MPTTPMTRNRDSPDICLSAPGTRHNPGVGIIQPKPNMMAPRLWLKLKPTHERHIVVPPRARRTLEYVGIRFVLLGQLCHAVVGPRCLLALCLGCPLLHDGGVAVEPREFAEQRNELLVGSADQNPVQV